MPFMHLVLLITITYSLPDLNYQEAESRLKSFRSLEDLNEIELLLDESHRPGLKVFDSLFEIFFFGELEKGVSRNFTKAAKYLNKGLKYKSSKAVYSASVIFQQVLISEDFKDMEELIEIPELNNGGLRARHDGHDLLEISYYAAVYECLLLEDHEIPEILKNPKKDVNETVENYEDEEEDYEDNEDDEYDWMDNDWQIIYPVMEEKYCGFDKSLAYSAISQAYYARDFIEELGRPPHEITQESLISDISYGSESKDLLTKIDKLYSNYKFTKGIENLGKEYLHGNNLLGLDQNYDEAFNYFSKSVDLGSETAAANIGSMYLKGLGVEQNVTKGIEYLEQAADSGSLDAMRQLSVTYSRGEIVQKNKTKAFLYARKAADMGDVQSINNIGVYYLEGMGVEKNEALGVDYIEKASNLGSPAAMYNMATVYYNGDHRKIDLELSFELSLKVIQAAQQDGFMKNAYDRFKQGDYEGSFLFFLFAESLGYEKASKCIAFLIEKQLYVPKCRRGAYFCLSRHLFKGVLHSDKYSYTHLADILYYGKYDSPIDYKSALNFYSLSPNSGQNLFNMAFMLGHGLGTEVDLERAHLLYRKIIDLSKKGAIDKYAQYPAAISLYYSEIKSFLMKFLS